MSALADKPGILCVMMSHVRFEDSILMLLIQWMSHCLVKCMLYGCKLCWSKCVAKSHFIWRSASKDKIVLQAGILSIKILTTERQFIKLHRMSCPVQLKGKPVCYDTIKSMACAKVMEWLMWVMMSLDWSLVCRWRGLRDGTGQSLGSCVESDVHCCVGVP